MWSMSPDGTRIRRLCSRATFVKHSAVFMNHSTKQSFSAILTFFAEDFNDLSIVVYSSC